MKKIIKMIDPEAGGAGDIVEKITRYTGIKWATKLLFKDCGCDRRKEMLNKRFPAIKMTEEQRARADELFKDGPSISKEDLYSLYNEVFGTRRKACDCSGQNKIMTEELISIAGLCG